MSDSEASAADGPRVGFHVSAFGSHHLLAALSALSRCGFEGIEIYGDTTHIFASDPGEFRAVLQITQLDLAGVHSGGLLTSGEYRDGELAEWRRLVEWTAKAGGSYAIFYGGESSGTPAEDLARAASFLNEIGGFAAERGVKLLYEPDRSCPFRTRERISALLSATDPAKVGLSVDTAFLTRMGLDPSLFVVSYKQRIGVIHMRDLAARPPGAGPAADDEELFTEIGLGTVDLVAVAEAIRMVGYREWIVGVVDRPRGQAIMSADGAAQYMRDTLGLEF